MHDGSRDAAGQPREARPEPGGPQPADVDRLVTAGLPFVRSVVAGLSATYPRHCDRDDLVAAGTLGLVEAALRFDPAQGVPFERWCTLRIRGAVLDAVRAVDFAPRSLRAAARDLEAVRSALLAELGRTPRSEELADRMGLALLELVQLEGRLQRSRLLSLDAPARTGDGEQTTLAAVVRDGSGQDPLAELERRERDSFVRDALALLPDRLRVVVVGYFLEGRTSAELAERLGVTESRVSQLRSEGLELLRSGIGAQFAEGAAADVAGGGRAAAARASYAASLARRSSFAMRLTAAAAAPAARPLTAAR